MAFMDGLHNRVNIYPFIRNTSNRTNRDQGKTDSTPVMEEVPCRIIDHSEEETNDIQSKVLFASSLSLESGTVIEDIETGIKYEIQKRKNVFGKQTQHHTTYLIERKALQ